MTADRLGLDATYRPPCVFDIETVSILDVADYIETPAAPINYRDEEKIAAYVEERRRELISRAALDPDLARVVAIGSLTEGETEPLVLLAKTEDQERALLEMFWRRIGAGPNQATLIGFNVLGYDLRVLLRRSLYLDVKAPPVQIDKYRHAGVIDLLDELSFHGAEKYHSLHFYIRRFGLGPFADETTGASIGLLVAMGEWATVEKHCAVDVQKTAALAKRMGVL